LEKKKKKVRIERPDDGDDEYEYKGDKVEDIDDSEYYKQEVGQEPDSGLFSHQKRQNTDRTQSIRKKFRRTTDKPYTEANGETNSRFEQKKIVSFSKFPKKQKTDRNAKFLGFSKKKKHIFNSNK